MDEKSEGIGFLVGATFHESKRGDEREGGIDGLADNLFDAIDKGADEAHLEQDGIGEGGLFFPRPLACAYIYI